MGDCAAEFTTFQSLTLLSWVRSMKFRCCSAMETGAFIRTMTCSKIWLTANRGRSGSKHRTMQWVDRSWIHAPNSTFDGVIGFLAESARLCIDLVAGWSVRSVNLFCGIPAGKAKTRTRSEISKTTWTNYRRLRIRGPAICDFRCSGGIRLTQE